MFSRNLFTAIVAFVYSASAVKINKCCPLGEIVQIETSDDNLLSSRTVYGCVKRPDPASSDWEKIVYDDDLNDTASSLSSSEFMGYNVLVDLTPHWPACGGTAILAHKLNEPMKSRRAASCVDVMNDAYYVFTCDEKKIAETTPDSDLVDVFRLRKCCPSGMSYDIFARKCVVNNDTDINDNFSDFFHDKASVLFESTPMRCTGEDTVLVEYHSHVHEMKMYETALVISNFLKGPGPEVFTRNSYCVESTLNSEVSMKPDGMSDEHFRKRAASKFIAKVCRDKIICNQIPCIKKCCQIHERMALENRTFCEPHDTDIAVQFHSFNIQQTELELDRIEPSEYGIMISKYCERYVLGEDEAHFISGVDGSLFVENNAELFSNEEFCVDYFYDKDEEEDPDVDWKMRTFVCFNEEHDRYQRIQFTVYATMMTISAVFLGITFLVYIFLPKLLNLHGKTVVCHVIALFIGYSFLSIIQFNTDARPPLCMCIAFMVYFGLFAAFSWLNVMCLDIYWTFGSVRASHGIRRTKEMKRFMYYSAYAWGFPFIMTIFTYMIDFYKVLPPKYQPNIGKTKCWFEEQSSPGHLIFFLFPIGIQISINFILFILTAVHCNRIKAEIHRMQMCDNNDQAKKKSFIADRAIFVMNVKLFCVMGISWLLEIIATVYKHDSVWWHISDVFNCLQGVMVFLIFVCKKKVLVAFQKKLGIRVLGLRPKTPGSTTLSTLDLNSTSMSRHNGKMNKSSSAASNLNSVKN